MRIAVDAMGGDHAPEEIVHGAIEGLAFLGEGDELVLFGREESITPFLPNGTPPPRVKIVHAPEVIGMDDSPVEALKQKRQSSMVLMAKEASEHHVDAVISAGNTGALALDISDEADGGVLAKEFVGPLHERAALDVLAADRHEADTRISNLENALGVGGRHLGVLKQVNGLRRDVGADVTDRERSGE